MAAGRSRLVPFEHPMFRRSHSWNLDDPWSDLAVPSRMWDQYFGMGLTEDDFFSPRSMLRSRRLVDPAAVPVPASPGPLTAAAPQPSLEDDFYRGMYLRPRRQESTPGYGLSEVSNTGDEFRINLDVAHFKPEEIQVKTLDNKIVIHAKHEEKEDEHGFVMREFQRSYLLPKDVDPLTVKSTLSADGVLGIKGPKKSAGLKEEHVIPIEHTSSIAKPISATPEA